MIDYSQPTSQDKEPHFKIKLKFEHGDADLTTYETIHIEQSGEEELSKTLDFLFAVRNFCPKDGYEKMGYYRPLRDLDDITNIVATIWPDEKYPSDVAQDIIKRDEHYSNNRACLEDIELYVNGQKRLLMDMNARKTNVFKLPALESEFTTDMGHINGSSVFEKAMPYQDIEKAGVPMHEDEAKEIYTVVRGKVKAYQISQRYTNYDVYDLLIKMEHEKDIYFTHQLNGHVEKITKE